MSLFLLSLFCGAWRVFSATPTRDSFLSRRPHDTDGQRESEFPADGPVTGRAACCHPRCRQTPDEILNNVVRCVCVCVCVRVHPLWCRDFCLVNGAARGRRSTRPPPLAVVEVEKFVPPFLACSFSDAVCRVCCRCIN